MSTAKTRITKTLETYFCDIPDLEEYETRFRRDTSEYLEKLDLDRLADYYKALGDEKRLGILKMLEFREMCVCELTIALGISQPNLSHHIKKLESAGLVKSERRGKWVYYSLADKKTPSYV